MCKRPFVPFQVRVYAQSIHSTLVEAGFRVEIDTSNESMGKKIRAAKNMKLPYFIVIGDKEVAENTVTVESRDTKESSTVTVEEFLVKLNTELNV